MSYICRHKQTIICKRKYETKWTKRKNKETKLNLQLQNPSSHALSKYVEDVSSLTVILPECLGILEIYPLSLYLKYERFLKNKNPRFDCSGTSGDNTAKIHFFCTTDVMKRRRNACHKESQILYGLDVQPDAIFNKIDEIAKTNIHENR